MSALSRLCAFIFALGFSVPASAASWTGPYSGVHIGVGQDTSSQSDTWTWLNNFPTGSLVGFGGGPLAPTTAPMTTTTTFTNQYHHSSVGLIGGVQAGYNWQFGRMVVGLEGDWSGSTQRDTVSSSAQPVAGVFPPVPNFFFIPGTIQGWTSEEKIDWLTTLRGRVGFARDSFLWYVTGGAAAAKISSNYTLVSSPGNPGLAVAAGANGPGSFAAFGLPGGVAGGSSSTTKFGWALGAGVETSIGDLLGWGHGWSAKLEYLYVDLGTVNTTINTGLTPVIGTTTTSVVTGSTTFTASNHVREQIVRVGFNYKFADWNRPDLRRN